MATGIDSMIVDGQMPQRGDTDYAVVGGAIAYNLQMNMNDMFTQLEIYAPRRTATSFTNPKKRLTKLRFAVGNFAIQQEFDSNI